MLGVYDFCGHYEWTFEWLRRQGGEALVREYWDQAIAQDSQRHAARLIEQRGIAGMAEYWGHTLEHEAAGYDCTATETVFRIDMHVCPSKGFLVRNGLEQYHDYCDHCLGWIGPLLRRVGFVVDHEHNHCGRCWWEIRRAEDPAPASQPGELAGPRDVRLQPDWELPIASVSGGFELLKQAVVVRQARLDRILQVLQIVALLAGGFQQRFEPSVHHIELALDHLQEFARDAMLDDQLLRRESGRSDGCGAVFGGLRGGFFERLADRLQAAP